jgi:hypothetical protein
MKNDIKLKMTQAKMIRMINMIIFPPPLPLSKNGERRSDVKIQKLSDQEK